MKYIAVVFSTGITIAAYDVTFRVYPCRNSGRSVWNVNGSETLRVQKKAESLAAGVPILADDFTPRIDANNDVAAAG